jgi:hypothetical protein
MKQFHQVYDNSIGAFAKDEALPQNIRDICSVINGNAIALLYNNSEDVLSKLNSCDPTSACENEYLLIEFVSQPQRFR